MSKLALLGGKPIRSIPYKPYNTITKKEISSAITVLKSGILSGFVARGGDNFLGGVAVKELERAFCVSFRTKHAISVNSATSGIHSALMAAGVGPGDEVLVPAYTMSATAAAIAMCKAAPIFVDIEPETFCMNPVHAKKRITGRTKAIITVNLFGLPSDLDALRTLSNKHNLVMIEDNAQAPGAHYKGRFAGTIGDMGVFSLNRHKTMQCGEGGVVITNNDTLADRLRLIRNHGEVVISDWNDESYDDIIGANYRLTELQAVIATPQIESLDELNMKRIELAEYLNKALKSFDFIKPPQIRDKCTHVYYLYPMLYESKYLGISRDSIISAISAEGIQAARYAKPIHQLPLFANHQATSDRGFDKLFPNRNGEPIDNRLELYPMVQKIDSQQIITTNICRPPNTRKEIDEFISAIEKIEKNSIDLKNYDAKQHNKKVNSGIEK